MIQNVEIFCEVKTQNKAVIDFDSKSYMALVLLVLSYYFTMIG